MKPVDPDDARRRPTILQQGLAETIDPDAEWRRLFWSVELQELLHEEHGTVITAHARRVGSRRVIRDVVTYELERTSSYYADLNSVELAVDLGSSRLAVLAPREDIMMYPRGAGLGRLLMSMMIRHAKERCPERRVAPAKLGYGDAETDGMRDHRNNFYAGHGYTLSFPKDPGRRVGNVSAARVADLRERVNDAKVKVLDPAVVFAQFVQQHTRAEKSSELAEFLQRRIDSREVALSRTLRAIRWQHAAVGFAACVVVWLLSRQP
jgi:GNAT superfamily N-acetyltransferase